MSKGIPKKTVAAVLARDRGLCVLRISRYCTGHASCADHRANRGSGGAKSGVLDQASNLVAACAFCNGYKEAGGDRGDLVARGLRVEGASTHAKTADRARATPVQYPDGCWWLLDDNGGKEKHRDP